MSFEVEIPLLASQCRVQSLWNGSGNTDPFIAVPGFANGLSFDVSGYPAAVVVTPDPAVSNWCEPIFQTCLFPTSPPPEVDPVWSSTTKLGSTEAMILWWDFPLPAGTLEPMFPVNPKTLLYSGDGSVNTGSHFPPVQGYLNEFGLVPLQTAPLTMWYPGQLNRIAMAVNWQPSAFGTQSFVWDSTAWHSNKLIFKYAGARGRSTVQVIG